VTKYTGCPKMFRPLRLRPTRPPPRTAGRASPLPGIGDDPECSCLHPIEKRFVRLGCGQIFQSLRMSLNRSQCGGCSTKYDTPTGTKVVYRRFCASTLLCMFVKKDEEGWHWTLCARTKVSSLIRGMTGDEPPTRTSVTDQGVTPRGHTARMKQDTPPGVAAQGSRHGRYHYM
jgi:hypothetical protein